MDVDQEEKQRIRDKIEKLRKSKFKQQTLSSWRPKPTGKSTFFTFAFFGIVFLGIGGVLFMMSEQIFESTTQYNEACKEHLQPQNHPNSKGNCNLEIEEIESDIKDTVYVYYQIDNYYQNHRRYVKSRDYGQLNGNYKKADKLGDCDPVITVGDLWEHQRHSVSGHPLKDTEPAIPCGLIAKSMFNDTFILRDSSGKKIPILETNIAWQSDIEHRYQNMKETPDGRRWKDVQWIDMQDEHFIVWMRTAGLPEFRKLWGRIEGGLNAGKYKVEINNQFEVAPFQGKKHFVLATSNALGGKNYFLAIAYIVVGSLSMFFAFVFCVANLSRGSSSNQE